MSSQSTQLVATLNAQTFGTINISPDILASYFQNYIHFGSKRYTLSKEALTVYRVPDWDFAGKNDLVTTTVNNITIPDDLESHLKCGTKFLDAVLYMHILETERPITAELPTPNSKQKDPKPTTFSDHTTIAKYMFFYYFYILTRARAPSATGDSDVQPVPKFLSGVLSISASPREVAEYLCSFELNHLDPAWVKSMQITGLGQEALSRFGLGVAGYRLTGPFKLVRPDHDDAKLFEDAIAVAKSFATEPADWDFHPSTRNPNLLTKFGNINKNLGNLILKVYKRETIDKMVKAKVLYQVPIEEFAHSNYTMWRKDDMFVSKSRIFPDTAKQQMNIST